MQTDHLLEPHEVTPTSLQLETYYRRASRNAKFYFLVCIFILALWMESEY